MARDNHVKVTPVDRRIEGHRKDVKRNRRLMATTIGDAIRDMLVEGTTKAKREEIGDLGKKIMDKSDELLGLIDGLEILLTKIKLSMNRRHR